MMYYAGYMPKRIRDQGIFEAIDWVMLQLDLPEDTQVSIEWKTYTDGTYGEVFVEELDEDGRWFTIHLNRNLRKKSTITTIFHEMVHIKQFCTGRLFHGKNGTYWLGKLREQNLKNSELPWEIEAYEQERLLYNLYKKHVYETH